MISSTESGSTIYIYIYQKIAEMYAERCRSMDAVLKRKRVRVREEERERKCKRGQRLRALFK